MRVSWLEGKQYKCTTYLQDVCSPECIHNSSHFVAHMYRMCSCKDDLLKGSAENPVSELLSAIASSLKSPLAHSHMQDDLGLPMKAGITLAFAEKERKGKLLRTIQCARSAVW